MVDCNVHKIFKTSGITKIKCMHALNFQDKGGPDGVAVQFPLSEVETWS